MTKGIRKKQILIIEDEKAVLNLLTTTLEKAGYTVKIAEDGVRGLLLISELKPDLVLLDVRLPKLDGFSMLEKLKSEGMLEKLPVIVISNSGQPVDIDRALELGVRDYVIKVNFDPSEILNKVKRIFNTKNYHQAQKNVRVSQKSPVILIIEDDQFLIDLLGKQFEQQHYEIARALDTKHARKIMNESAIALVLLDVVLPGQDGFTFLSEVKKDPKIKDIPVIILSNLGQKQEIEKGLEMGAVEYLVKADMSPREIVERVKNFLEKK